MPETWYTADLHIGHRNIIKFSNRPFIDVDHMNDQLVQRWNDNVKDDDTVWVLGDLLLGQLGESLYIAKLLRGKKYLLCGNHDRPWCGHNNSPARQAEYEDLYEAVAGFAIVNTSDTNALPHTLEAGDQVQLSHFPYAETPFDERYATYRPRDDGDWLLHGHVHEAWKVQDRQINVGVDVWDYTPVNAADLHAIIREGA